MYVTGVQACALPICSVGLVLLGRWGRTVLPAAGPLIFYFADALVALVSAGASHSKSFKLYPNARARVSNRSMHSWIDALDCGSFASARHCAKYFLLCSEVASKVVGCGSNPRN